MFFDVRAASGPPATSTCGCASKPNWMLTCSFWMRSGSGAGAKGTYGLSDAGGGAAAAAGADSVGAVAAGAGTGAGASGEAACSDLAFGCGLLSSCSNSSPDEACANARDVGSNSATRANATRRWLSFMGADNLITSLLVSSEMLTLV